MQLDKLFSLFSEWVSVYDNSLLELAHFDNCFEGKWINQNTLLTKSRQAKDSSDFVLTKRTLYYNSRLASYYWYRKTLLNALIAGVAVYATYYTLGLDEQMVSRNVLPAK